MGALTRALRLDRSFWTPLLVVLSLAVAIWRMRLLSPPGVAGSSTHETAAFAGGVVGGLLFPWAVGVLVAYGHWVWNKARRDRDYMMKAYPFRRRVVLHGTVLAIVLLMALEQLWNMVRATGGG